MMPTFFAGTGTSNMDKFPRTTVGGVSVSRMIAGSNWFLGWSHTTAAKDTFIQKHVRDRKKIADILEVFFRAGVDTTMGLIEVDEYADAIKEAEDRTGVKAVIVSTPGLPYTAETAVKGFDLGAVEQIIERQKRRGATFFLPHTSVTDVMLDRCTRQVRHTRWYQTSGTVRQNFDDLIVQAGRSLPPEIVEELEPWNLQKLVPYQDA